MSDRRCYNCGTEDEFTGRIGGNSKTELRPYGPGGAWICYACANATPERKEAARAAFYALLGAASAPTGVAAIGTQDGPTVILGTSTEGEKP